METPVEPLEDRKGAGQRSGRGMASIVEHMQQDDRARSGPAAAGVPPQVARTGHTLLVVEDTEATRYALSRTLKAAGYNVVEAGLASEALTLAGSVSGVLLDVQLPDGHGFEVCAHLRTDSRTTDLPIIMVSAVFVEDSHRHHGTGLGADAYFVSPVNPRDLVEAFDFLLGIH